jgi:hypothetical protein
MMNVRNLNNAKAAEDFREGVEPDALVVYDKPLSYGSTEAV